MRRFYHAQFGLILLLIAIFFVCGCSEKKEIEKIMDLRQKALVDSNLDLYRQVVSINYQDGEEGYHEVLGKIERDLAAFKDIEYTLIDRTIYQEGDGYARVVQRFRLEATLSGNHKGFNSTEKFELAKETDGWRIIGGL
jgi:hypothetical protein